jgi:hypothetical protein
LRGRNTDGLFATTDAAPSSLVEAKREGRVVNVSNAGHPILQYQAEPADLPRPSIKPIYKRGGRIHPTEPFVCYAPSQIGDWEIAPGNPYVSRYRFIAQDGPPNAAELERLWQDYTHPPQVKIESQ